MRCASAGADRPECGICAGPAYVVTPQAQKKKPQSKYEIKKSEGSVYLEMKMKMEMKASPKEAYTWK